MIVSPEWILASFVGLAGVIATMAKLIHKSLVQRIESQDRIITHLRQDVDRLSKGCGLVPCLWAPRAEINRPAIGNEGGTAA